MTRFRSARTPIGLDLAPREIRAVQFARTSAGYRVEAAVVLAQPESASLDAARAKWIADVLTRQGFRGNRVVVAAPVAKLEAELLELPPRASGAPVEQIARGEMANVARLTEGFEMACWDLPAPPRGGAGTSLLAVALRHTDADALIDPLESVGLDVRAIDARAWALARAVAFPDGPAADAPPMLVLDLEWDGGFVVLVHHQGVLFQRVLGEVGIGALYRSLAEQFDLTDEVIDYLLTERVQPTAGAEPAVKANAALQQARVTGLVAQYAASVTEELEQSLAFVRHRYPDLAPKGLTVTGPGARIAGLCAQLASRLRSEVTPVAPASRAHCSETVEELCWNPSLAVATGLAMYTQEKRP